MITNGDWTRSEPETVIASLPQPIPASTLSILTATIARRLTPQAIKLRADIELTCYTPSGIDAIKKALRAGEKQSNETVPIKAKLVAPPLYVLSTNATDKVRRTISVISRGEIDSNLLSVRRSRSVGEGNRVDPGYDRGFGWIPRYQNETQSHF